MSDKKDYSAPEVIWVTPAGFDYPLYQKQDMANSLRTMREMMAKGDFVPVPLKWDSATARECRLVNSGLLNTLPSKFWSDVQLKTDVVDVVGGCDVVFYIHRNGYGKRMQFSGSMRNKKRQRKLHLHETSTRHVVDASCCTVDVTGLDG